MPIAVRYGVSAEIFQRYPSYRRGVVIAHGLDNGPATPELLTQLRASEQQIRSALDPSAIADHPRISTWRDAFRSFGAKPSDFRPSVEALARRAARGDELPSISTLVDIGTIASLQNLMPVGAHALDEVAGDIELRFATGAEQFTAFGSADSETPLAGEVILAEGSTVLTRRWVWRQADHTLVTAATRSAVVNVDALAPADDADLQAAISQAQYLVQEYCGATTETAVLSADEPSVHISIADIKKI
jgi:DNA/RNA-binding domain of Phe-tRNA-synthetase-like protein